MMELKSLKCPNCGSIIDVEDEIDIFFCKYCGHKIILADLSDAAYYARTTIKGMEHDEKMIDKKYSHERFKIITMNKIGIIIAIWPWLVCAAVVLAFILLLSGLHYGSIMEENKLQSTIDEIMLDIQEGEFSKAYILAQSIRYTGNWSDEIETKWDRTRAQVISQIEKAERELTGKVTPHDSGKDSVWYNPFTWLD